jgi:hypothetical protein
MKMKKQSVANILEREIEPMGREWLRRVKLIPELTRIPLTDKDRSDHLPKLFHDVISRLRLVKDAPTLMSASAAAHGQVRRDQGYSAGMVVEESRVFEVTVFHTLHLHQSELDKENVLLAIAAIADEADAQLTETVCNLVGTKRARPAA